MDETLLILFLIFIFALILCRVMAWRLKEKPRVCRMLWVVSVLIFLIPCLPLLSLLDSSTERLSLGIIRGVALFVSLPILVAILISPLVKYVTAFLLSVPVIAAAWRYATQVFLATSRRISDIITGDVSSPTKAFRMCGSVYIAYVVVLILPVFLFQTSIGFVDSKSTLLIDYLQSGPSNPIVIKANIFLFPVMLYSLLCIFFICAARSMYVKGNQFSLSRPSHA